MTIRNLKPDAQQPFLAAVHRAFYAENRDVTDAGVLAGIAADAGVDENAFAEAFQSREMIYQTGADFHRSASMGVQGFPTVILRTGENYAMLVTGFSAFDNLKPHLDAWVETDPGDESASA